MHIQAALELINLIHFLRSCSYIEAKCVMCMFFNCTYTATYLLLMYAHNLSSQSTYCMKINISQRSCFPAKNAREAIVLLNGYQADSIKNKSCNCCGNFLHFFLVYMLLFLQNTDETRMGRKLFPHSLLSYFKSYLFNQIFIRHWIGKYFHSHAICV